MGRYSGKSCRLIFMLVLTVGFFVAEIVAGYIGNSVALVSDSFNMLSDLLSLSVGLTAARISRRAPSGRFTYGLARAEVVGALANAVFLVGLSFSISLESIKRLARPEAIRNPFLVLVVGAMGLAVNIVGLLIFQNYSCCGDRRRRRRGSSSVSQPHNDKKGEENGEAGAPVLHVDVPGEIAQEKEGQPLNIRGVLLHVLNDALGSVVVVVASTLFYIWPHQPDQPCNWQCYVDPSLTLCMVAIIMVSAVPLLKETISILLQMSPVDLPLNTVLEDVSRIQEVQNVHEVHVWELAHRRNVATLHVKCADPLSFSALSQQVRKVFHLAGVHSVTIQPEFSQRGDSLLCSTPCLSPECQEQSCCPTAPSPQPFSSRPPATPTKGEAVSLSEEVVLREYGQEYENSTKF